MATILLQAAGAALGGVFGPVGSAIGAAAGALAGYSIDRALINSTRRIEGPRLSGAKLFSAEEGVPLPRVYGSARLGGIVIWATRFEETRATRRQGGKLGPKVTEYSYFANVAFALCEGEIAGVRRVWADGREVDLSTVEYRVHRGSEDQDPDPLLEAKQGAGNTPAYRGVGYVVIEHFALADYGNRIPQFQFEVLRPVGNLRGKVRAVALLPGATEYGLSPQLVTREKRAGETVALNRHVLHGTTDLGASLDELQKLCPNLEHVALVVSWFGNDLRAGNCLIRPAVTTHDATGLSSPWLVSGVPRGSAMLVSQHDGGAAYGGTPSDRSVIEAIVELKARGLGVTLYPFIMLDIPQGNALPDPYGGLTQSAYPWRGRMTCMPAPGLPGSADKTASARSQIELFCGDATAADFSLAGDTVAFAGTGSDWGFRRFVLHHAKLAACAGGVDAFLIGSELRGLTGLRDHQGEFPFVQTLASLASEVRDMLGPLTKLTYGADWSEYFGHHPGDGTGDVFFHLDELWAHPAIDAVGIDNYMPISDWRDGDYSGGNPDGFAAPCDPAGLRACVAGGEGFHWYYPTPEARRARERVEITDGAGGKPWVFRYKDLKSWWSQPHFNRPGGIESATPTDWGPRSKPIWFTELGCPAVDKGPNQPNIFPDAKSVEGGLPYFSSGGRSDLAQARFFEAHFTHWEGSDDNPTSPIYGAPMVDTSRVFLWSWDARPYPAFPLRGDSWADSGNWHSGHWLNGRLGAPTVGDLINAIMSDHGLPPATVEGAAGTVHGYVVEEPGSARTALQPLVELFGLAVMETADGLAFREKASAAQEATTIHELAVPESEAQFEANRLPDHQLPTEAVLSFRDPLRDYQAASVRQVQSGATGVRQHAIGFTGTLERGQGEALIADWLRRAWAERESLSFAVSLPRADLGPGALVRLPAQGAADFLVTRVEDGLFRRITAQQIVRAVPTPWRSTPLPAIDTGRPIAVGRPLALFLDLPSGIGGGAPEDQFRVAAWQAPWRRQAVFASPALEGFAQRTTLTRPADVGSLAAPLESAASGRLDKASALHVELFSGEFASVGRALLLNGANTIAVRALNDTWEIVQFETAEEVAPGMWQLSDLLRGQLGTEDGAAAGAAAGAPVVVLDEAVQPAGLLAAEVGLMLTWRVGPLAADLSGEAYTTDVHTGGLRALTPLAPVHLRAAVSGGDVAFSWVRRGRIDADSWTAPEIPLGEEEEKYQVELFAVGGALVRTAIVTGSGYLYPAGDILADFGMPPTEIEVSVRQHSRAIGWGFPATSRFDLP